MQELLSVSILKDEKGLYYINVEPKNNLQGPYLTMEDLVHDAKTFLTFKLRDIVKDLD